MQTLIKQVARILIPVTLILSCSPDNKVSVVATNFEQEIETLQNLAFTFDRDLAPDSVLNLWDSASYIKFTPEINGAFKWVSARELVFSPSGEFKPSTAYTAMVSGDVLRFRKSGTLEVGDEKITFRTPYLKVLSSNAWWSLADADPGSVTLNVTFNFNYHIDPAVISRLLNLKLNGRESEFRVTENSVGQVLSLRTGPVPKDLINGCNIQYEFKAGATCPSCGAGAPQALSGSQAVKAPDRLEITHVECIPDHETGTIRVYCNQEVSSKNLQQNISLSPKINFTIEPEGSGFLVRGNFEAGGSYELTISKNLSGILGGALEKDYVVVVPFGEMEPSIGFTSGKGAYMSTLSSKKLGIRITNIPKVRVKIFKIYENNIQAFIRYHRYSDYYDEERSEFNYNDYNISGLGDEIMNQEYETKNLAKQNGSHLLSLDFPMNNQFSGIYLVSVASAEDRWIRTGKIVSISDIGLIARQSADEVYIFANSIKNATPLKGTKISFISSNNQELYTATTDNDGMAVFKNTGNRFPGFHTGMITARQRNDFNFLVFQDTRVENSRFDIGGKKQNPSGYEAFLYGDREIYRPGETVHINIIIRNRDMKALSSVPVKAVVLMPNGREYMSMRQSLNSQGAAGFEFRLTTAAVTGTWNLELYSANDVLLNSRNFSVEEFLPDRISVTLKTPKTNYTTGDSIPCEVTAMNLFGTPASQRNYEMDFNLRKKVLYSKKFSDYNFSISGADHITFSNILRQGKTDTAGKATEFFPVSPSYEHTGLLSGTVHVTVFDETGRPVNRVLPVEISTQKTYFGILLSDYYNNARQPMQIRFAATDASGNPVAGNAGIQVIRVYWETIMERTYGSRYHYVSQKREKILVDKQLSIAPGSTSFSFTPNESGEYLVRIREPQATTYVESEFYAYGWGYTQNNSFEVNNEGRVEMEFDKEQYEPGDAAKILMKTPFAGRILVTVERDKVFDYFYVNTDKRSASVEIPVKESYLPNVYVTATLIRPLDEGIIPVTIAHGFAPLKVEKKSTRLPVSIQVAEKSRSNTRQKVTVKTAAEKDIEVTVAVVDEGIMQLKNSESPDPHKWFYQKQALEVGAFDLYPFVLPDILMKRSSVAGDGYDLQKRVNPLTNKRVKLVSYWSGILRTDGNGMASCFVDIPQFSGDLRVMAVVYRDNAFGSDEKHIKVADPVVISPSVPRFLSPGDTLIMPVTITNTTSRAQNATVSVELTGPLSGNGELIKEIILEANLEQRPVFRIAVAKQIGEGQITIKVKNGNETYTDKTDITVRPPSSLQKISGSGELVAGTELNLELTNQFIPASRDAKLVISRSPVVQFSDQLSYLLGYPYGCVEQTISTAFPQLYYSSLVKSISNRRNTVVKVSENINAAIRKLQSMQQHNGAMSYWPGGDEESWWGSAYATHFLFEARKAGYEVPTVTTDKLISYLGVQVKKHPVETYYYYNEKGIEIRKEIPSKDIFYSLYLLSLYDHADLSTMNFYRARYKELALDSRYLLAASYQACGDLNAFNSLLPEIFEGEKSKRSTGGNFYSYIRDEALSLNALLETDPSNQQIGAMARHLSQQMKSEKYLSTQERAFTFLALGKFLKQAGTTNATATIIADGTTAGTFSGEDLTLTKGIVNGNVKIKSSGNGKLYYFWEMEGLTADGSFTQEDSYLKVRKTFLDRNGKPVKNLNQVKLNDLIVVRISLVNLQRNEVENIVISDLLPAGIEIENPRIAAMPELSWIKDSSVPEHMDIRDDRIHYFTSISSEPKNFYYLARAVSTGQFIMGPVSADAMYDGSYHSYHGAGKLVVQ